MKTEVGGPSRRRALVQELTARCLPGSADPDAGRRAACRRLRGYCPKVWPGCCAIGGGGVLWSLSPETRENLPLETPLGVSDALTRVFLGFISFCFWRGGSSCCRDTFPPPPPVKGFSCPARQKATGLSPEQEPPHSWASFSLRLCLRSSGPGSFFLVLRVVSAEACSGWGIYRPWSQSSDRLRERP